MARLNREAEVNSFYRDPGTPRDHARVIFLLYYSRSGSTFLSSRLDRYEDIGVTVESEFMYTLLLRRSSISRARSPQEVYGILRERERFDNLGITRESFCERLREGGGYTTSEITRTILALYFADRKPGCRAWVVKDGANGYWMSQIARAIPEALFVHLVRDGRAVLNSGLHSFHPYNRGERMARDPLTAARTWTWFVDRVDEYAAEHPERCIECRYEDLMSSEQSEIDRIRRFFALEEAKRAPEGDSYYENIPEQEKPLHSLVSGDVVPERVGGWKNELSRGARLAFEYRASDTLRRHGYEVPPKKLATLLLDKDFLSTCVASWLLRVRGWFRLLLAPDRLRRVVTAKTLYRRDRRT